MGIKTIIRVWRSGLCLHRFTMSQPCAGSVGLVLLLRLYRSVYYCYPVLSGSLVAAKVANPPADLTGAAASRHTRGRYIILQFVEQQLIKQRYRTGQQPLQQFVKLEQLIQFEHFVQLKQFFSSKQLVEFNKF